MTLARFEPILFCSEGKISFFSVIPILSVPSAVDAINTALAVFDAVVYFQYNFRECDIRCVTVAVFVYMQKQ